MAMPDLRSSQAKIILLSQKGNNKSETQITVASATPQAGPPNVNPRPFAAVFAVVLAVGFSIEGFFDPRGSHFGVRFDITMTAW